jgi:hypothetical protein
MKIITILLFCILALNNRSTAQDPYFIGFKGLFETNWLTNQGFDELNQALASNNIASLQNIHGAGGYTLVLGRKNRKLSFEFAFGGLTAIALNRSVLSSDIAKPSVTGRYSKMLLVGKMHETPRWRVTAGGGLSFSNLDFILSDLRPQTNTLSNLVNAPSLSPSLIYTSSNLASKIEILAEIDYRTKLIREQLGELTVGLRTGYGYQLSRNSNKIQWFVKQTQNQIERFPLIIMDNFFIQINAAVIFNLASRDKK